MLALEKKLLLISLNMCIVTIKGHFISFSAGVHVFFSTLKGLVHPKMKIKSLITHPHAVPTP